MSSELTQRFIKKSSETAALFHHFPGAIYEFRDRIWRVTQMYGNADNTVFASDAFRRLLNILQANGIQSRTSTTPQHGISEVFPMSWYCSNPSCNKYLSGELRDRDCPACKSEMRQLPLIVICDACGYNDAIKVGPCRTCHGTSNLRLVMYDRNNLGSWRIVCKDCLGRVLQREGIAADRPEAFKRFEGEFAAWTDLEPSKGCPNCPAPQSTSPDKPGKRIVPAGSSIVSPAFVTTFDQDTPTIKSRAITTASKEFSVDENLKAAFERIRQVFSIEDIYLTEIMALNCTYGYRIGKHPKALPFGGGSIFLRSEQCGAILFQFKSDMFPIETRAAVLHAAAHALVQVVGYVSGLGNEAYREFVDTENCAVMIFTPEAGGCDLLIQEPIKLVTWLKQSRAIVHDCKNQCTNGCPWCLHLRTYQCSQLNHNLDRKSLSTLWDKKVGL